METKATGQETQERTPFMEAAHEASRLLGYAQAARGNGSAVFMMALEDTGNGIYFLKMVQGRVSDMILALAAFFDDFPDKKALDLAITLYKGGVKPDEAATMLGKAREGKDAQ